MKIKVISECEAIAIVLGHAVILGQVGSGVRVGGARSACIWNGGRLVGD